MESRFLADTYALVEMIEGNPEYRAYLQEPIVTTKLNIMELYYAFLRKAEPARAEQYLGFLSRFLVRTSLNSIRHGMHFKLRHRKEKLSYADCIGYAMAAELGMKFLTGDSKFAGRENVEFVK